MFQLGLGRIGTWFSSADDLVMFVRDASHEPAHIDGFAFREAAPWDAGRFARDIGTDSPRTFRDRLTTDTKCFVVDDGTRFVHASWVTTSAAWTRELSTYLTPPATDAYVYESFTRTEVRGRGIYPFALRSIVTWAFDNERRRVWVAVEAGNEASLRAVAKADFREAFRVPFQRRLGRLVVGEPGGPFVDDGREFLSQTRPVSHL